MRRHRLSASCANLFVLSLSGLLWSTRVAGADDGYRDALLDAMSAKERAMDSHSSRDWEDTLRQLQHADSIRASAETKYEMAYAQGELGQADLALVNYQLALELGLTGTAADKARAYIVDNEPSVARVDIRGMQGTRVIVRGIERGQLPLKRPIPILPGIVAIQLVTQSNGQFERQVNLVAGQIEIINLEIAKTGMPSTRSATQAEPQHPVQVNRASASSPVGVAPGTPDINANNPLESHSNASNPWRPGGWLLLGAGTAVSALGAVFIPTSSSMITNGRRSLLVACDKQTDGPDSCANAKSGRQAEAQSASDSIATWKMFRTAAWISLATGATAAVTGATILIVSNRKTGNSPSLPQLSFDSQHLFVSYHGSF